MSKKIDMEELDNVSGGHFKEIKATVTCPKCHVNSPESDALLRRESNCGNVVKYYKCPNCDREWSKEIS